MTLTETRPEEVAPSPEAPPAATGGWLTTADHKRVGLLFLAFSLLFLLVGGVLGGILRAELVDGGVQLVGDDHARIFSMHATVSTLLFLIPAWIGLATYLVPLQIGASRLAFPRLQAFALWLYAIGGGVVVAAYLVGPPQGEGTEGLGINSGVPVVAPGTATELWAVGLALVATAFVLAAGCVAVTVLKLRTRGLTFPRLPLFTVASFATSAMTVLATPVFVAGLLLVYLDARFEAAFFAAEAPEAVTIWQHSIWLLGRPEVFLLALPALGALADIVATSARRSLIAHHVAVHLLLLFGVLTAGAWILPANAHEAIVLPNPGPLQAVLGGVAGLIVLLCLGTLVRGRPRLHVSLLFVLGGLALAAFGAINAAIAAVAGVTGGAWTEGHLHTVFFGFPTVVLVGALYHWAPKLFGRPLSPGTGGAVFLLLFGGFLLMGLGEYLLGYNGAPARVADFPAGEDWGTYSQLAAVGAALLVLGALALVADLVRAVATRAPAGADDPYEGLTLEWATASPPPPHNFDAVPEVRSPEPLKDLRPTGAATA